MRRIPTIASAVTLVAALLAGCGGSAAACRPVRSEPYDRRSLVHVLPGGYPITFLSDPPTSGPHQPSPPVHGVVAHPIDRPVQVGILEAGEVLLQHRGLAPADLAALRALAGEWVVIAPNADLPEGDRIVATAWLTKQECTTLDVAALRRFITAHQQQGPGNR